MEAARRLIDWARRHTLVVDAVLAGTLFVFGAFFLSLAEVEGSERTMDGIGWMLVVTATIAIVFRRQAPVRSLWLVVGSTVAFWVRDYLGEGEPNGIILLVALYSLAAHVDRPRSIRHGAAVITILMMVVVAGVIVPSDDLPAVAIPANLVVFVTAWVLGDALRSRRAYLRELEHRVSESAARRDAEMRQTVLEERTRIARELHDVVAHSLSVIVVQAGAARRVIGQNPERADDALGVIEHTGRESLDEIRRIVGVLREDEESAALGPAPSVAAVPDLVQSFVHAGLPVDLTVTGDVRQLGAGVELASYRIVQESLTNVLRHAGKAEANVNIRFGSDRLDIEITDDGRGAAADHSGGSGNGLTGMRERVEAYGGRLDASPVAGGGFRVAAWIPVAAALDPAGR